MSLSGEDFRGELEKIYSIVAEATELEVFPVDIFRILERARKIIDLETFVCYDFNLCTDSFVDLVRMLTERRQRVEATQIAWIKTQLMANLVVARNSSMLTPFEKYDIALSIAIATLILYLVALSNPEFRNIMLVLATFAGYRRHDTDDEATVLARVLCSIFYQQYDTPDTWLQRVRVLGELVVNAVATAISLKSLLEQRVV